MKLLKTLVILHKVLSVVQCLCVEVMLITMTLLQYLHTEENQSVNGT